MINIHSILLIAVVSVVTMLLRFLPLWIFGNGQKTPEVIQYLGKVLPYAIMGMLVVYCLKDISFADVGGFLPQLIACAVVAVLYVWRKNTLLSIVCGTVCYMLLVQLVF